MPFAPDRPASRFGRDRDLLPDGPRTGPYEAAYDIRHGYEQPVRRSVRRREEEPMMFFLGRVEEEAEEQG